MCGIAGIISKHTRKFKQCIKLCTDALSHRGPEDEGFYFNEARTVALGHRRLSIIDLSQAAKQPMSYAGRYHIIHNGELYNYLELKIELKNKGYSFHTDSDSEVILVAYAAHGAHCLQHFEGMFAFAIWDEQEQTLFAARDRFGEKPFFFYYDENQFVFASEMKALWQAGIKKKVNERMLYNFLTIDYTSNPYNPQETFYEGIRKLLAASFLFFSLPDNKLSVEKYWQVHPEINTGISEKEAVENLNHLFANSIKKRLRSDVPIGTSLSGGLDSSTVVAFCDKIASDQYAHTCFTAVFPGFEKDEQQHATLVANQFNLQHQLIAIKETEVVDIMEAMMKQQEEPMVSASALAQYKVYEAAKQAGITVLLDGQGADEILAGYHKYYSWFWMELYKKNQASLNDELNAARKLGVKQTFGIKAKLAARLPQFSAALQQSQKKKNAFRHSDLNRDFSFSNKENLYYSLPPHFDLNSALHFNTFQYGLEDLLRLADRNSMAHGIEIRLPFLSHELVAFLFTLPPSLKIHHGWTKWLLRKVAEPLLPKEIVWRKDKVGFEPPQKLWMQNKQVQEAIQAGKKILSDQDILNASAVNKKIQPHDSHVAENNDWKYWAASFLYNP